MFKCCKERKKFKFSHGTEVVAVTSEQALLELQKIVKESDENISWKAYLDFRELKEKLAEKLQ